jgi:6-phosphofructokinase 2
MESIVTITPNPAIDIYTTVEEVTPTRKLRCKAVRRDAGGGGINVARVVRRFGGAVAAICPIGGATGNLLRRLVDLEGVQSLPILVTEETREDFTVLDRKAGHQYRFVLPGSRLSEEEWNACLTALEALKQSPAFIVGSGSLPPGVPDDFYARVARIAKSRGSRMVIDTSGAALSAALKEGVYLAKPNLRELQELCGVPLHDRASQIDACRKLIETGSVEVVVLTLGAEGALLVTAEASYFGSGPPIAAVSAVGAGDSFVGGMMWKLAVADSLIEAFRFGVAAGSAAVLSPGTELCHAQDVVRLYADIRCDRV